MKTKQAAINDMSRSLVAGSAGYVYQYMPSGSWNWASEGSPVGRNCAEAEDGASVITSTTGRPVAAIYQVERVVI